MNKVFLLLIVFVVNMGLVSCSSTDEKDEKKEALSEKEKDALIENARKIVLESKNVKLTPQDKQFIAASKPEFRADYTGRKSGKAFVYWILPDKRVYMESQGQLLESDRIWRMSITKTGEVKIYKKGEKIPEFKPKT